MFHSSKKSPVRIMKSEFICEIFEFISVMVRGTMTPDTYKPILRVSVLPIDKKVDGFQMYSSKEPLKLQSEVICLITLIYTSMWWQNK